MGEEGKSIGKRVLSSLPGRMESIINGHLRKGLNEPQVCCEAASEWLRDTRPRRLPSEAALGRRGRMKRVEFISRDPSALLGVGVTDGEQGGGLGQLPPGQGGTSPCPR